MLYHAPLFCIASLIVCQTAAKSVAAEPAALPKSLISSTSGAGQNLLAQCDRTVFNAAKPFFQQQETHTLCSAATGRLVIGILCNSAPSQTEFLEAAERGTQGSDVEVSAKRVRSIGMTHGDFSAAIRAQEFSIVSRPADEVSEGQFLLDMTVCLSGQNVDAAGRPLMAVAFNFYRPSLDQPGGGHWQVPVAIIPPAKAGDKSASEKLSACQILFADVNIDKFTDPGYLGFYWVPGDMAYKAIGTKDGHKYRGYHIVYRPENERRVLGLLKSS